MSAVEKILEEVKRVSGEEKEAVLRALQRERAADRFERGLRVGRLRCGRLCGGNLQLAPARAKGRLSSGEPPRQKERGDCCRDGSTPPER